MLNPYVSLAAPPKTFIPKGKEGLPNFLNEKWNYCFHVTCSKYCRLGEELLGSQRYWLHTGSANLNLKSSAGQGKASKGTQELRKYK